MRQIKTEHGTYKIADSRNLEEFLKQLKKSKPAVKRAKLPPRQFPAFVSGTTSTREYVEAYYRMNGLDGYHDDGVSEYVKSLFGELPDTPAPDQPIDDETIEVSVC
jgi:predicted translin family RNA/ssDNA-binding protein